MKALEETFAETMPSEMGFDYAGMSFQERKAQEGAGRRRKAQEGVSPAVVFGMSLLFVFLILAALRELDAAVQRAARHTHRGLRRVRSALGSGHGEQHLRADRAGHAHRHG